jgi:hypothetical protein
MRKLKKSEEHIYLCSLIAFRDGTSDMVPSDPETLEECLEDICEHAVPHGRVARSTTSRSKCKGCCSHDRSEDTGSDSSCVEVGNG